MLRLALIVSCGVLCGWAVGCAGRSGPHDGAARPSAPLAAGDEFERYESVPAAALVFTPRVVRQERPLDLSREGRAPEAFVGFEHGTVEHYYVRTDDRQRTGSGWNRGWGFGWGSHGSGDRYERHAVSERFGVRHR